uniref:FGFR1 oncogene partner 2 homolog n=1 Tax=Timema monikensis TaxID=170555 RepID=A0A7R9E2K6_9NEOP|nr:unnamed protein product [Timema monikensis]
MAAKRKMSLTIQQIILDAKRLASRLKDHDTSADVLLSQTQSIYKQIDAMRQYQEEVSELNDAARQRPHTVLVAGIQQENRHLRELQQENRELRAALEEHQNALELIMSKYRQQVTQLVASHKLDLPTIHNQKYAQVSRDLTAIVSQPYRSRVSCRGLGLKVPSNIAMLPSKLWFKS